MIKNFYKYLLAEIKATLALEGEAYVLNSTVEKVGSKLPLPFAIDVSNKLKCDYKIKEKQKLIEFRRK